MSRYCAFRTVENFMKAMHSTSWSCLHRKRMHSLPWQFNRRKITDFTVQRSATTLWINGGVYSVSWSVLEEQQSRIWKQVWLRNGRYQSHRDLISTVWSSDSQICGIADTFAGRWHLFRTMSAPELKTQLNMKKLPSGTVHSGNWYSADLRNVFCRLDLGSWVICIKNMPFTKWKNNTAFYKKLSEVGNKKRIFRAIGDGNFAKKTNVEVVSGRNELDCWSPIWSSINFAQCIWKSD